MVGRPAAADAGDKFTSALRAAAVAALTATLGVGLASGVKRAGAAFIG
jgi:hypothetical protein